MWELEFGNSGKYSFISYRSNVSITNNLSYKTIYPPFSGNKRIAFNNQCILVKWVFPYLFLAIISLSYSIFGALAKWLTLSKWLVYFLIFVHTSSAYGKILLFLDGQ